MHLYFPYVILLKFFISQIHTPKCIITAIPVILRYFFSQGMLDNKFVIKQTMLRLVSKNSLSSKAFKVNGEVYMNCLTKTTSDPNPAVYILCSCRCYCWQGSTRRCHPALATSIGEAPLSEGTWTYTRLYCPLGPDLFLPCTYPHSLQVCSLEQVPK